MHRIALSDSLHLHAKNFPSFFKYLDSAKITPTVFLEAGSDGYALITATGHYAEIEGKVSPLIARYIQNQAQVFEAQDADTLYSAEVAHLRLWPLCRSEMLAYLLTLDNWQAEVTLKGDRAIFDKAWAENRETLAMNMSAASYWLNHWYDNRAALFQNHYCCVFSGSMTYVRTLMELLRRSPTKVLVMESTFTGNDYIFEEMYQPVANNVGVKHPTLRESRRKPEFEEPNQYDREIVKARNKVLAAQNKNVTQPPERTLPRFAENRDQILIVGQVANDFSLIEEGFPYVGSIPVYVEMLDKLLDQTDCNIIFKAHPWEHKKVHLKAPKTFDALASFVQALPDEKRARILLVDDVNLYGLIDTSQYVVTLCSQAGIEAALLGMKPFILGQAFYSGAGFTEDCPDINALVGAVRDTEGLLDLEGYKKVDRFLVDLFQYGTMSIFDSGVKRISKLLERPVPLEQNSPLKSELELGSTNHRGRAVPARWSGMLRKKTSLPHDPDAVRSIVPQVDIEFVDFPEAFSSTVGNIALRVAIFNESNFVLPPKLGGKPFNISYHIYNLDGGRYVWNGEVTELPQEVYSDAQFIMTFKVPEEPGRFKVVPALVYPGVCWFDAQKAWEIAVA